MSKGKAATYAEQLARLGDTSSRLDKSPTPVEVYQPKPAADTSKPPRRG